MSCSTPCRSTRWRSWGLDWDALRQLNPRLIYACVTPFGRSGPWRDYKANDLVHLALGGPMMCCGYDPKADGSYDTPPIAPQMWHAYHITGNQTFIAIVGALIGRETHGNGDMIEVAVHQAVSVCTEIDVPNWIYNQTACYRQTGRHAQPAVGPDVQFATQDGRYSIILPNPFPGGYETLVDFLDSKGQAADLKSEAYQDAANRRGRAFATHFAEVQAGCVAAFGMEEIWRDAQSLGIPWSPIRKPEENLDDQQWQMRKTFCEVDHPELDESLTYMSVPPCCPTRSSGEPGRVPRWSASTTTRCMPGSSGSPQTSWRACGSARSFRDGGTNGETLGRCTRGRSDLAVGRRRRPASAGQPGGGNPAC